MRIPFIAGNWKMNTTLDEAVKLVGTMRPAPSLLSLRVSASSGTEAIYINRFV